MYHVGDSTKRTSETEALLLLLNRDNIYSYRWGREGVLEKGKVDSCQAHKCNKKKKNNESPLLRSWHFAKEQVSSTRTRF